MFNLASCEEASKSGDTSIRDTDPTDEADTDTDTDADTDTDTDTDTDSDTDTDTDPGTPAANAIAVYGLGYAFVPPGGDYFDFTANGIAPYSFSRHSMQIVNNTAADVTIDSMVLTPQTNTLDSEWTLIDANNLTPTPFDITNAVIPAYGSLDFDMYFVPVASDFRVEDITITYDGTETYPWTMTGRGRDALMLSDSQNTVSKVHGDPVEDTLSGGAVGDGNGNIVYNGNVNGWSDGFSENIVVSKMSANGTLAWSKEWHEAYEQLSPDSGQNGETGGGAESIAYAGGSAYIVGHRSQSNFNSRFQSLVMKVDATTGAMGWAVGFSPENIDPPSLAWQNSHAYAVDASIADRVIVTGTSFDNAEVLLFALRKSDGSLIWSKQIDIAPGYNDRGHTVAVDGSGNAWIGGITDGRGFLARVTGVDGAVPTLDFVKRIDMGIGSNINSMDVDSSGAVFVSMDRRGLPTWLSVAKFASSGAQLWAKTWDDTNAGDNNNTHVVRLDESTDKLYVGGRVAVATADTQFGDAFLMRLNTADGSYDWGMQYYTGKGAEEVLEHRVKGIVLDGGDLQLLVQSYTANLNFGHYWGYWYDLQDNPLADLTLGEVPGDGAVMLVDYNPAISDVTLTSDFHDTDHAYNGNNVATVFTIDTNSIWQDVPAAVTFEEADDRQGNAPDGDNTLMFLDLP